MKMEQFILDMISGSCDQDQQNRWSGENHCNWWVHLCYISFVIFIMTILPRPGRSVCHTLGFTFCQRQICISFQLQNVIFCGCKVPIILPWPSASATCIYGIDNTNWQGMTCTSVPQFGLYWNRANVFWERTPYKLNCFLPNPLQFLFA